MKTLVDAVVAFEERLIYVDAILEAFDALAGDESPAWLLVLRDQMKCLNEAFEPVGLLSRGGTP
jgi:hypothetical protein